MKKITILAAALFCVAAQANAANSLNGTWKGAGHAVDNQGKPIECESVVLTIAQTATSITVNSAFTCGGMPITVPGGALDIKGTQLLDKGQAAGTITDRNIDLTAKSKGYVMHSTADFDASTMRLHSVISMGSNPPMLTFDANLRR